MDNLNEMVEAYLSGQPYDQIEETRQPQELYVVLLHIYMLKGYAYNRNGMDDIIAELKSFILRRHGNLTLAEIKLAWEMGIRCELGNKDNFPSIANLQQWLNMYVTDTDRVRAITNYENESRQQERAEKEKTKAKEIEEQNKKFFAEAPAQLYKCYLQTGGLGINIANIATYVYNAIPNKPEDNSPITEDDIKKEKLLYLIAEDEDVANCIRLKRLFDYYKNNAL